MKLLLKQIFGVFIILLFSALSMLACECRERRSVEQELAASEVVVIAKLQSTGQLEGLADTVIASEFEIWKVYKGNLERNEKIRSFIEGSQGKNCTWGFGRDDIGKFYLLYLGAKNKNGGWDISTCSRSAEVKDAKEDIDYLRKNASRLYPVEARLDLLDRANCGRGTTTLVTALNYKNTDTVPLILYKARPSFGTTNIYQADSAGKLSPLKLSGASSRFYRPPGPFSNSVDKRYFVILAPGETYRVENLRDTGPFLGKGDYAIDAVFGIHYPSAALWWKTPEGKIWASTVNPDLLKFSVLEDKQAGSKQCKKINALTASGCHITVAGVKTCEPLP